MPRLFPSLFWPSPPPAAAWLRCPAFASGVAAPSQKTDRCPCSASAVSAAGSASAAQSRTRGRLPSQSRRPYGRLASSPPGRAKCTPVGSGQIVVRQTQKAASSVVTIQQKEPLSCPLSLAPLDSSPVNVEAKTKPLGYCLPRVRGRWPAGPERATTNNAEAGS